MYSFNSFLLSAKQKAWLQKQKEQTIARRTPLSVVWNPLMKWEKELNIKADTYKIRNIFDVQPTDKMNPNQMTSEEYVLSSNEEWFYCVKRIPRGTMVDIYNGNRKGTVMFDGPVLIPCLHNKNEIKSHWREIPFMSLTPMEIMSLRSGTQFAKGTTVVVGLGLGHQLIEVSQRKQVKRLVLVEKSQDLVDWLLPKIKLHLGRVLDEVVIGDAHEVLPKLEADVALIDIFPQYGGNVFYESCPKIKKIWCWGSASSI